MTWGPDLTCHTSWPEARRRRTAAQGACKPPCDYTPFHLRRNQQSRRRTAAQGVCNRPAVIRPFISAATSGQGGEPLHKERATAPQLCAPLGFGRWSNLWHGGPGPHVMHPARRFLGAEKLHRRSRQYRASSRPSQKTEKINFQNQCSDSRHPAHGPTNTLSAEVTGQSAAGIGMAVGVTMGGPAVIASTGVQEQRANRQSKLWPHLQARILP
jgi:hypothetical protein